MDRAEFLTEAYKLQRHPEGGWFSEVYTAPFESGGRPMMGSIYFLLDGKDVSHFHELDSDELWYFHEGTKLSIILLENGVRRELLLGMDPEKGGRAMVLLHAGSVFAAKVSDGEGYTFMSCATVPAFRYEGFRLVGREEIADTFPGDGALLRLAFDETARKSAESQLPRD